MDTIQQSTIGFLKDLIENNHKEWMDANRNRFEKAKKDFELFVTNLIREFGKVDKEITNIEAKHCIFRLNRDIRFSKNKSPYKHNFAAAISKDGKKFTGAGYYFHLEPGNSFIGAGIWMPDSDQLRLIRQEIDYSFNEFKEIITGKRFRSLFKEIEGGKLKTVPRGYDDQNPAIEYLKLKNFTITAQIADNELTNPNIVEHTVRIFSAAQPFVNFLNQSFD